MNSFVATTNCDAVCVDARERERDLEREREREREILAQCLGYLLPK